MLTGAFLDALSIIVSGGVWKGLLKFVFYIKARKILMYSKKSHFFRENKNTNPCYL